MKKILMVVDNEFRSDPRVYNEAKILASNGYDVLILCFNFSDLPLKDEKEGIKILRIPIAKKVKDYLFSTVNTIPIYDYYWAYHIKKAIETYQPDFLHIHDLYMVRAANLANKESKKIILDLHENYPAAVLSYNWAIRYPKRILAKPKKWKRKEYRFLKFADRLIVLSENYRDDLISKYPDLVRDHFVIYPNVPDIKELYSYSIDKQIIDADNKKILFYFGGIAQRRGIFTCFEALKILLSNGYNVSLLLIGPIDRADHSLFNKYLNDTLYSSNVIHFPWKDISTLPSYIYNSMVCLSPILKNEQHESGVANKVFQYMLFEKPVIVSDCKPQVSIIEKYKCGLTFKSEDANDLAAKIKYIIDNPKEADEMGANGKNAVLTEYNIDNYKANLLKMYTEL